MHIVFALAGLHKVRRGAEVAFESIANEIALRGEHKVTLLGSGESLAGRAYNFRHVPAMPRQWFERWPKFPYFRNEFTYEELTFAASLLASAPRLAADVTVTCGYPYTNWALRTAPPWRRRPPHVFLTQHGDWAAHQRR